MSDNKKIKKWIISFATAIVVLLAAVIAVVAIIDPFFQYHKPLSGFPYVVDNQLSQNAGMAKNFEYNSILTGSSMVSNFDLDSFSSKLGDTTIKVNYNGAYPKDISNILEYVYEVHPNLERVYFGMDIYSYNSDTDEVKYPLPDYLYDRNIINDISYVFNKDVLVEYIVSPLRFPSGRTEFSKVYMMEYDDSMYSAQRVLSDFQIPKKATLSDEDRSERIESVMDNLTVNLIPYIESHPETEFVIFYPPYSILYWYIRSSEGWTELLFAEYEKVTNKLLQYENVRVFSFSDCMEKITDLNNYVDYTHQHARVNEYILDCFNSGENEITLDSLSTRINEMRSNITSFDYEQEFNLTNP